MEQKNPNPIDTLQIGSQLSHGAYDIIAEYKLFRVRIRNTRLECLIDSLGRVCNIFAPIGKDDPSVPKAKVDKPSKANDDPEQLFKESADELFPGTTAEKKPEQVVENICAKFAELLHRYSGDSRGCFTKMEKTLSLLNYQLMIEFLDGGLPALKSYLIREYFGSTTREDRGFKILFFLTSVISLNDEGVIETSAYLNFKQQEKMLTDFMAFLLRVGKGRMEQKVFVELYKIFENQEFRNLAKGGVGYYYIRQFFVKELEEIKSKIINDQNYNYIDQMYRNSVREPQDLLQQNVLSYLKALAIVRLYAKTSKNQRGGDSKKIEAILSDIIAYQEELI